jgi:tetratricopeptide (TPR) repeat protein
MLRRLVVSLVMVCCWCLVPTLFAQDDDTATSAGQTQQNDSASASREAEVSSSKDTRIDLAPPRDDAKNHPDSGVAIMDSEEAPSDVDEMHAWDPHKAAKDIEVGDYYFKRKNYRGALERYKDALTFKPNDALANFRLAECEEKINSPTDAAQHYEAYLKILPHGPFAVDAQKALDRLKTNTPKASIVKTP